MARALWFTAPRRAELREEPVREPGEDEVLVRGVASLVSAGSEMRVYRGEVDPDMALGLDVFGGSFAFPVKFAYQIVGEVEQAGPRSGCLPGQLVFARHPHQDRFVARNAPFFLHAVPPGLAPDKAAFANLLDVALNALLDVPVRVGDVVVVYGQGVIGSFCGQLARRTAGAVVVVDPIEARRRSALEWGADAAVAPADALAAVQDLSEGRGADISIEVSGSPAALQQALATTGQEGTIAVVSFFGSRAVPLVLSPEFHYRRLKLVSSQVRLVGSGLEPRWDLGRRIGTAMRLLADGSVRTPPVHVVPFERAPEAYELIDTRPEEATAVLLSYEGTRP